MTSNTPMHNIKRLCQIMAKLRQPDTGCPWDIEQNFASIAPYAIEEAHELADAIATNNPAAIKEELGDLLLQVIFHAQIASERGWFDIDDIAATIADKMITRHPHIFGNASITSADAQSENWETIKQQEREQQAKNHTPSLLDGIAHGIPALMRAEKLQKRAARVGFDWPSADPVWDKLDEESAELKQAIQQQNPNHMEEELGDMLFVCVNLARKLGLDAEACLRKANHKFEQRFRHMEQNSAKPLKSQTPEELEQGWQKAK